MDPQKNNGKMEEESKDSLKVQKVMPNKLTVDDSKNDDNSCIEITVNKAQELGIMHGETVLVQGKKRQSTICLALTSEEMKDHEIRMNKCVRKNIRVKLGDTVVIKSVNAPNLTKIEVRPFDDSVEGVTGDIKATYLVPYFQNAYRPLKKDDTFIVKRAFKAVEFKVLGVEPGEFGVVAPNCELFTGEAIKREDEEKIDEIGYDDIGGCDAQMAQIREMIELPLRHPKLFTNLGAKPPRGILMFGPPGSGKTLIARAIANETGATFFVINGPEIMSSMQGESEKKLRRTFEEAEKEKQAIIFIDEIDSIAPKREKTHGELEKRIVSQLLTLMDGVKKKGQVIVIGATNRPNSIDPALRRPGRFDKEIDIGVPDEKGRLKILQIHTRNMRLDETVKLEVLASETHGFVGADMSNLCQEAARACIRDKMHLFDIDQDEIDAAILDSMAITHENFKSVLINITPSSIRELKVEVPNVKWEDIGGMDELKVKLNEMITYPNKYADVYKHFGSQGTHGILFYGPPGCGKTLMAKAIATEASCNFISIKGPELLTMWFGESESNVRDVFEKARGSQPCVLFFDEIDSIANQRGSSQGDAGGAGDRVTMALLTEMDGVGSKKEVYVIGATNRPSLLDSAIMRPGRLDQLVYIGKPDEPSRMAIFNSFKRKTPLDPDVDLGYLAKRTEGFSGADISEFFKNASQEAIRSNILERERLEKAKSQNPNIEAIAFPVPTVSRANFLTAWKAVRKSYYDESEFDRFMEANDPNSLPKDKLEKVLQRQGQMQSGGISAPLQWPNNNQAQNIQKPQLMDSDLY